MHSNHTCFIERRQMNFDSFGDEVRQVAEGYFVSESGRVYTTKKRFTRTSVRVLAFDEHHVLMKWNCSRRYPQVNFVKPRQSRTIHRLVAEAFIPNPDNLPFVCHRDDDVMNCTVQNLFWGTHKDNMKDRQKKGRNARGERSGVNKLTRRQVEQIRSSDETIAELARRFGLHRNTVSNIVNRRSWNHI